MTTERNSKRVYVLSILAGAIAALLALPAIATNPYLKANNTWITLTGTVESVSPDTFLLDYGEGTIIVEVDDGDRDADAYKLFAGDKVSVTGKIDADLFERTTIEASRIYVDKISTYFYASAIDEEDALALAVVASPLVTSSVVLQGTVTDVKGDEFTLDRGATEITVDVGRMLYDPLDNKGYQRIKKGDFVSVTGEFDYDLIEGRELMASSVTTIGSGS